MISCLEDNYIGIKNISEFSSPTSGIFINQLEGITTQQLDDIKDQEDHYEENDTWLEIYDRALNLLFHDIKSKMAGHFKKYSYISNNNTSVIRDFNAIDNTARYGGYYFNFLNLSPNLTLQINHIDIHLESSDTIDWIIADAATGETIDSGTHNGRVGQNRIHLNKKYPFHLYQKVFVAIDASSIQAVKHYKYASNLIIWPNFKQVGINEEPYFKNFTSDTAFFSLKYNIICDIDNFVCQRIDLFTFPFLYKLGIEFHKETLGSNRFNRYTLLDRETTMEMIGDFEKEYNKMLENSMKDTRLDYDGICFECSGKYNKPYNIP